MDTSKISAQKRRTLRIIHDVFLTLLKEKPLEKITVNEISELADMNRTTFYRYYTDVYALMDDIMEQLLDKIFYSVINKANKETLHNTILNALNQVKDNKEMCKILLYKQIGKPFENRIKQVFLNMVSFSYGNKYSGEAELQFNYMINGFMGMLHAWVQTDCAIDEKRITQIAEKNINDTFKSISDMTK